MPVYVECFLGSFLPVAKVFSGASCPIHEEMSKVMEESEAPRKAL